MNRLRTATLAALALTTAQTPMLVAAEPQATALFDLTSPLAGTPEELVSEGVRFRIPGGYIHDRTRTWGSKDGIHLWMLWPGLVPQHPGNVAAFRAPGGGAKLDIRVIVFTHPELRSIYLWRQSHEGWYADPSRDPIPSYFDQRLWVGERYGLKLGLIDFEKVKAWLSSQRRMPVTELKGFDKDHWEDLLYREDETGRVQTVIKCTNREVPDPPEEEITGRSMVRVPQCSHEFVIDEINSHIAINYRRIYAQDWMGIEVGLRSLLLQFHRNGVLAKHN